MAEPLREPEMRLEMRSKPRLLAAARAMVGNVAQRLGFNDVECGQISLAVDESLCNIINHGYDRSPDGRIWISIFIVDQEPGGIEIVIDDLARQVDPGTIRGRDLDDIRPGGLGVYIIREIMDKVEFACRPEGGMSLTMFKQLSSTSNTDESSGGDTAQAETSERR